MQRVAQDWLVLTIPGNGGAALGITTGLQFLPVLLLSPYAGVVADRFSKRRLLQVTQTVMALAALALGVIAALGVAETWHVYLLAFVFGIGAAFDAPARQAFVSELVGTDDVANAVSLNSAAFNTARLVGPGLAGLLIGLGGGGMRATGWVIMANALSYGAVIWQLRRMDPDELHSPRLAARTPGMLRAGLTYLRGEPKMLMILVLVFFVGTFGMNFQITSALMATEVFGKGAQEYGVLGSVLAIGSLTGALVAAGRSRVRVRLAFAAAICFGVLEVAAGLAPSYLVFVLLCPLLGFSVITVMNSCNAMLQIGSDPLMRGRVMAIYMTIVMGGTPLGAPLVGWIGEQWGARWTLVVSGTLVLVGVVVAVLVRALLDREEDRGARDDREAPQGARRAPAMLPS